MRQSENYMQAQIVQWYWNNYCLASHEPRSIILHIPHENQHRLSNLGVYAGCADLFISHKGLPLWVEVKTPTGKQSPNQIKFQSHAVQCGMKYILIRSLEDFKELIINLN